VLCSAPASRRAGLSVDAIGVITTILLIGTVKESRFPTTEAACARQNEAFEGGCHHVDALEYREDRNRWRDRAVAMDQGGAEEADGKRGSMVPLNLPQFPRFEECGPLCDGWLRGDLRTAPHSAFSRRWIRSRTTDRRGLLPVYEYTPG
jgi:hypothetical protein